MSERVPRRIQRKRTKGWRMPEGAVYVGRPTKWGNGAVMDEKLCTVTRADGHLILCDDESEMREAAVEVFRQQIENDQTLQDAVRAELRGKDLCCWCPLDAPCHADVLLEIANRSSVNE